MTQVLPERNFSSREDTLRKNTDLGVETGAPLTTSDVIILGEDLSEYHKIPYHREEGFIGPLDATNEARPLLEMQSRDLAKVAVMNLVAYGREYQKVINAARGSVADGTLRLNGDYPDMPVEQQIDAFVSHTMADAYRSHDEVAAELALEKVAQNLGSKGPERELQLKVNGLEDSVRKLSGRILKVREMLIEKGASDEFIRKFDYETKLMTKPDQEAYEREMELDPEHEETPPLVDTGAINLFEMFKTVLSPSFGKKALRSIGILPPKSGAVDVIPHSQTVR